MAGDASTSSAATAPQVFPQADADALAVSVADCVARLLREAIDVRGKATMAVSGGRSPVPMFRSLRQHALPWDKVTVTLVDERWVSADCADSNERLVRKNLLVEAASPAQFLAFKTDVDTPAQAVAERTRALRALPLPFDVIILGMGEDGHTASLFPGAPGLAAAMDSESGALLAAVAPPKAPHARLTLTLHGLLASRCIVLQVSGEKKRSVLAEAMWEAAASELPIAAILRQRRVPVAIYTSP